MGVHIKKDHTMTRSLFRSPRRALFGLAVPAAGLLAGALTPRAAHAMAGVAADPLVTLSNGIVLDMSTTIYDPAGLPDVQHVSYTLHLPKGVAVSTPVRFDPVIAKLA